MITESAKASLAEKSANLYAKLTLSAYDKMGKGSPRAPIEPSVRNNLRHCAQQTIRNTKNHAIFSDHNPTAFILKFFTSLPEKPLNSRGSVLIEFAVCMPVLIILLFYINDLIRIKRYYSQTEFVAQQMANILQNISQNRTNKRITPEDLKYAMTLANQTIYPGTTMFKQGSGHPLVHTPVVRLFYVTKGNTENTASCVWTSYLYSINISIPPRNIYYSTGNWGSGPVTNKQNVAPSQIYHSLKIDSEPKLIIESSLVFNYYTYDYNVSGQSISNKQALGLHIINPQKYSAWYCSSVVVFTPKPGLFDNSPP